MASGFCIFFGNLAEQYALALAGVTIAVPMFSSCIVVLGAAAFATPDTQPTPQITSVWLGIT